MHVQGIVLVDVIMISRSSGRHAALFIFSLTGQKVSGRTVTKDTGHSGTIDVGDVAIDVADGATKPPMASERGRALGEDVSLKGSICDMTKG